MLVLHQRDPATKLASKSPETASGHSPRHHPCCPAKKVQWLPQKLKKFPFYYRRKEKGARSIKSQIGTWIWLYMKNYNPQNFLTFFYTQLITFTWSWYCNNKKDDIFSIGKYCQMLSALLLYYHIKFLINSNQYNCISRNSVIHHYQIKSILTLCVCLRVGKKKPQDDEDNGGY